MRMSILHTQVDNKEVTHLVQTFGSQRYIRNVNDDGSVLQVGIEIIPHGV